MSMMKHPRPRDPEKMDMKELAEIYGLTLGSLLNKIYDGTCEVPTFKVARRRYASRAVVTEWQKGFVDRGLKELRANSGD
jgi:hypothetical protein